jgi:hypothetical protein
MKTLLSFAAFLLATPSMTFSAAAGCVPVPGYYSEVESQVAHFGGLEQCDRFIPNYVRLLISCAR